MAGIEHKVVVIGAKGKRYRITETLKTSETFDEGAPTPIPQAVEGGEAVSVNKEGSLNEWVRRTGIEILS